MANKKHQAFSYVSIQKYILEGKTQIMDKMDGAVILYPMNLGDKLCYIM